MANRYWVRNSGEGAGNWNDINNWSASSGGAVGASVPGTADLAYFEGIGHDAGNGDANCVINAAVDVLGVNIAAGYDGTISQGSYTVNTRASGWVQAGGTFAGGSADFTWQSSGVFTLTGGTFTAPSTNFGVAYGQSSGTITINGGIFNHNNGTFMYRGYSATLNLNGAQLNNFTVDAISVATLTLSSSIIVLGTLTLTAVQQINGGTIECRGNVASSDGTTSFDASTALLKFNGTGDQALTGSGDGNIPRIEVAKASGTLTISGTLRVHNGHATDASVIYTSGTVVNTSTLTLTGNGYLAYAGGTGMGFQNIIIGTGNTIASMTMTGTMIVNGTLTLSGTSNYGTGGTFKCRGDVEVAGAFQTSSAGGTTFEFDGTGAQEVRQTGGVSGNIGVIKINKASGTLTFRSGDTFLLCVNANDAWTHVQGTVVTTGAFLKISGWTPGWNDSVTRIANLEIASHDAHTFTITGTLKVANLTLTSISSINGAIDVAGDLVRNDASIGGTATITFTGSATQAVSGTGDIPNGTVTINKTGGSVVLASAWNISAVGQDLVLANGTLDLAGFALTVADQLSCAVGTTLRAKGTGVVTAAGKTYSGTVEYYDSGVTALINNVGVTFVNLTLGASKTHNVTAGTTIVVSGALASNGTSATRSILRSVTPGSYWNLNLSGSSSLTDKVDVRDSNASSGSTVSAIGSVDNGHNKNWIFLANARYFVGASSNLWNLAANWSLATGGVGGASVPAGTEAAVFDSNSPNCSVNAVVNVLSMNLANLFANTLTQNTYVITTGSWVQDSGTFAGGSAALSVTGDFASTGGTFTSTSNTLTLGGNLNLGASATFAPNSGTVLLSPPTATAKAYTLGSTKLFNNLTVKQDGAAVLTFSGVFDTNGTLAFDSTASGGAYMTGGTLLAGGNVSMLGNFGVHAVYGAGDTLIKLDGTGDQTILGIVGGYYSKFEIDKASGAVILSGTINVTQGWVWTNGPTLTPGTSTLRLWSGLDATGFVVSPGSLVYANVTLYGNATAPADQFTLTGTFKVGGNLLLTTDAVNTNARIAGGAINVAGNVTCTSWGGGTTTITLNGTGAQAISQAVGNFPGSVLTVSKASGVASLASVVLLAVAGQDLALSMGTLDLAGFSMTVNDQIVCSAGTTLRAKGNEVVAASGKTYSGTVEFYDGAVEALVNNVGTAFANLTFGANKTHKITNSTTLSVSGVLDASGDNAVLRSDSDGVVWNLNLSGSSALVADADVKDSDASSGLAVSAFGSADAGNNTNWNFVGANARYFVGAASSFWNDGANWSLGSGGSGGAGVPSAANIAVFDDNSPNCSIDAAVAVNELFLRTAFTQTVTQLSGNTVTVGSGGFVFRGGFFVASSDNFVTNGEFRVAAGRSFTAGAGQTISLNCCVYVMGTVDFSAAHVVFGAASGVHTTSLPEGCIFGALSLVASVPTDFSGRSVVVLGLTTFDGSATVDNGTIRAQADVLVSSAAGGTALLRIDGPGTQTIGQTAGTLIPVEIDKSAAVVLATDVSGVSLNLIDGVLDLAGNDLTLSGVLATQTGSTLLVRGTEVVATSSYSYAGGVTFYGAGTAIVANIGEAFSDLTLGAAKTHNFTAGTTFTVSGVLAASGAAAVLRSTAPGTQWLLTLSGTSTLGNQVDVQDSDASGGLTVAVSGSTDSGNNLNWNFGAVVVPYTGNILPSVRTGLDPAVLPIGIPRSVVYDSVRYW